MWVKSAVLRCMLCVSEGCTTKDPSLTLKTGLDGLWTAECISSACVSKQCFEEMCCSAARWRSSSDVLPSCGRVREEQSHRWRLNISSRHHMSSLSSSPDVWLVRTEEIQNQSRSLPSYALHCEKMVLYSTKSGSWLVIIGEPLLVLYSTISLKLLYSTFVKWCYVEP